MGKLKLDDDELVELTGLRQKNRQIEQLRKMRVPYFVNAQGYPVVIREQLLMKAEPETRTEPDWSAIGGARPTRRGS